MFRDKTAGGLAALATSLLLAGPAISQTTVLTGSASQSAVSPSLLETPILVRQTPKLAAPPVYPVTALYQASPVYPNNRTFYGQAANTPAPRPRTAVRVAPRPITQTPAPQPKETFWHRHPMVRSATIGAGVGAGAGALTGLVTHRGVLHGALVGAGAGAGVGVIRSSQIMRRHPIIKNTATGAVAGLGLGLAAGGHHSSLKMAGVGSAIGLGYGLFRFLR